MKTFGEIEKNFCKEIYLPGTCPFVEFFRSAFFHASIWSPVFGEGGLGPKFLNHRASYILEVATCIAMVDKEDTSIIYSYVFYREEEDRLVVYFIYTKKSFRQMGLLSELLRGLQADKKPIKISHTGRIPVFILDRKLGFERGGV